MRVVQVPLHLQISLLELQELERQMPMGLMLEHSTHPSQNNLPYVHFLKQACTGWKFTRNNHGVEKQNFVVVVLKLWKLLVFEPLAFDKGIQS